MVYILVHLDTDLLWHIFLDGHWSESKIRKYMYICRLIRKLDCFVISKMADKNLIIILMSLSISSLSKSLPDFKPCNAKKFEGKSSFVCVCNRYNNFYNFYLGFLASSCSITISALIVMNMTFWKTMLKVEVP